MLPPVLDERDASPFKFWFDHSIQDGMYHRSELYYRLHSAGIALRARVYHYACKMVLHENVIVTIDAQSCSIWVSLRSETLKPIAARSTPLKSFQEFMAEQSFTLPE
ncbi:MAG: hypothetical protein KME20_24495 [Kaiparowitsia implicata GSE-PSE-MK54-09C]|nr:hypothetical protein [Kaiparowitsia implicata GSE-PSE-MK54-09C]